MQKQRDHERRERAHFLQRKKAIIAICASGEGTAQKMKELIDKHLEKYFDVEIEVLPISVIDMDEQRSLATGV